MVPLVHFGTLEGPLFAPHVGDACGILPYQDDGETRFRPRFRETFAFQANLLTHLLCQGFSIENVGAHSALSTMNHRRIATRLLDEEYGA